MVNREQRIATEGGSCQPVRQSSENSARGDRARFGSR